MSLRSDRTNRRRDKNHSNELDWFAEDPWAETDLADLDEDDEYPGMFDESEEPDDDWTPQEDGDEWNEDTHDGWSAIRSRRKPNARPR